MKVFKLKIDAIIRGGLFNRRYQSETGEVDSHVDGLEYGQNGNLLIFEVKKITQKFKAISIFKIRVMLVGFAEVKYAGFSLVKVFYYS